MRKNLIKLRLEKSKTQQDIAKILGISRQHYSRIELGTRNPSYNLSLRIKKYFGVIGDDIFFDYHCDKMTQNNQLGGEIYHE